MMVEQQGFVLWLTGRSGAGKSCVADLIVTELTERGLAVRQYDEAETTEPDFKQLNLAYICAYRSPIEAEREARRSSHQKFVIVYVDAPERELRRRDIHGWYKATASGDVRAQANIELPYEPPIRPDIHIRTDMQSPLESAGRVLGDLEDGGLIPQVEL